MLQTTKKSSCVSKLTLWDKKMCQCSQGPLTYLCTLRGTRRDFDLPWAEQSLC